MSITNLPLGSAVHDAFVEPRSSQLDPSAFNGAPTAIGDDIVLDLTVDPPVIELRSKRLALDSTPENSRARVMMRIFDVTAASAALALASPVMLLLWVGVKTTSKGPGIFRSPRAAQGAGSFEALKFRTMVKDAEARLDHILRTDPAAHEEYQRTAKLVNDPRVTALGRLLRRTSLDELPQLWNVIKGDMAVVGPRPSLLSEPKRYGLAIDTVHRVKPGLTGLWQTSGRSNLSFDERIMLDVEYATSRTIGGDLKIIATTIKQLCRPGTNGAY